MSAEAEANGKLLEVEHLKLHFPIRDGIIFDRTVANVHAVDDVTFDLFEGETLGLVGESGCGKTTLGRTVIQLTPSTDGRVVFDGYELADVDPDDMRPLRRRMQIIFQDPFGSLNPRMPVSDLIGEGLLAHSDRGSQHASEHYQRLPAKHGITCSMSRRAGCWDNAPLERFFASLKKELVRGADFATMAQARAAIFEYNEVFYNGQRRHASLGDVSPAEYEQSATP